MDMAMGVEVIWFVRQLRVSSVEQLGSRRGGCQVQARGTH
jgi:hypothetical protein